MKKKRERDHADYSRRDHRTLVPIPSQWAGGSGTEAVLDLGRTERKGDDPRAL
jgi:hypothetical protein